MTKRGTSTSRKAEQAASIPSPSSTEDETSFGEVMDLIQQARQHAFHAVNATLIDLYWRLGEFLSRRIAGDGWGKGTIAALSRYIQKRQPGARGFSPQNLYLWRMRQFFDAYRDRPELSTLLRELPWSSNLHILTKTKRPEEREFYLRTATRERWRVREVARQIDGGLFERAVLNPPQLSTMLRERHPDAATVFQDAYLFEFLDLPAVHTEADLHRGLIQNLGRFLTELGRDFCFIGSEYPVQVGGKDFALDLLLFHRGLNCLVVIELKIDEFQPEYLGKLAFYLEALDRDVRKPHERPSLGVLLCATKDSEVVEYALSRSLSPALVAEYQTRLPDKTLLQAKLHEFYALLDAPTPDAETKPASATAPAQPRRKRGPR